LDECFVVGLVDPGGGGEFGWGWVTVPESVGVGVVGGGECVGSVGLYFCGGAVVERGWGVESNAGVAVGVVVVVGF